MSAANASPIGRSQEEKSLTSNHTCERPPRLRPCKVASQPLLDGADTPPLQGEEYAGVPAHGTAVARYFEANLSIVRRNHSCLSAPTVAAS